MCMQDKPTAIYLPETFDNAEVKLNEQGIPASGYRLGGILRTLIQSHMHACKLQSRTFGLGFGLLGVQAIHRCKLAHLDLGEASKIIETWWKILVPVPTGVLHERGEGAQLTKCCVSIQSIKAR